MNKDFDNFQSSIQIVDMTLMHIDRNYEDQPNNLVNLK
jgi:hypothetical protein